MVAGDFNNDEQVDLAVTCPGRNTLNVFFGDGYGNFSEETVLKSAWKSRLNWATVGDFNGDDRLDLAVVNTRKNNIGILFGFGNGTFQGQKLYSTGIYSNPDHMVLNDFNNDRHLDLAVTNLFTNEVGIMLGTANGTFLEQITFPYAFGDVSLSVVIATGDLNGDRRLDIVIYVGGPNGNSPGNLSILLNSCDCCRFKNTERRIHTYK